MKWFVLYVAILTATVLCYMACSESLYKKGGNPDKKSIDVVLEGRIVLRFEVDSLQYLGDPIIKIYYPFYMPEKIGFVPDAELNDGEIWIIHAPIENEIIEMGAFPDSAIINNDPWIMNEK